MRNNQPLPTEDEPRPDEMRVLDFHKIADHTYEVVTESASRGRVTRKVLVLPTTAVATPLESTACKDR